MNASIIDPLQGDFPEVIEEYLHHDLTKCIAFNRRGTLLAAGCTDGSCVIWDFETRGIAKELRDKEFDSPITSVCWSKYGHRVLVSAVDKSLTLWDVVSGEKISRIMVEQTVLHARLHPGSSTPSLCLACPLSSAPMIVDLNTGSSTLLPVSIPDSSPGVDPPSRSKISDVTSSIRPTAACFNKCGDLVYAGNSKGEILLIDYRSVQILAMVPTSGGSMIKNIVFSRNGQYLLTNSNDRTIRIYGNLLPLKDGLNALKVLSSLDSLYDVEKLKVVGSKCLTIFREFQDTITKVHWRAPCFSGDSEWVIGGSASTSEHKIYIWDRAGHLVKILEGPKEGLIDLVWHPVHPIVVSVSMKTGLVYIWAKDYTENWSAFAPDFKELEENEEYIEREDEFDIILETEKAKEFNVNEDDEIDIMTVDKDPAFSDSDISLEELCFLPATPSPDATEQHDKDLESSTKLVDNNSSGSPLAEERRPNGSTLNHASSPLEEDHGATRLKRKRKPSEKWLDLQL